MWIEDSIYKDTALANVGIEGIYFTRPKDSLPGDNIRAGEGSRYHTQPWIEISRRYPLGNSMMCAMFFHPTDERGDDDGFVETGPSMLESTIKRLLDERITDGLLRYDEGDGRGEQEYYCTDPDNQYKTRKLLSEVPELSEETKAEACRMLVDLLRQIMAVETGQVGAA